MHDSREWRCHRICLLPLSTVVEWAGESICQRSPFAEYAKRADGESQWAQIPDLRNLQHVHICNIIFTYVQYNDMSSRLSTVMVSYLAEIFIEHYCHNLTLYLYCMLISLLLLRVGSFTALSSLQLNYFVLKSIIYV